MVNGRSLPQTQLQALYPILERMNSVCELPELLAFILDRVLEHTGGRRGYLLLARPSDACPGGTGEADLEVAAARGAQLRTTPDTDVLRFVSGTVAREVLQRGEPRVIRDLLTDERYRAAASQQTIAVKWRSILAVPLKIADRLIGLMYIEHPDSQAFANPDLDFLSAFAGQAAAAIDRAQQSQRRIEELERLSEIGRAVVRVLDLDQVLIRIMHEATRLLEVETGSVLLVDEATGDLVFRVSVQEGRSVSIDRRLKMGQGIAGWVAQHGEPLLAADVCNEARWYGEVEDGFSTRSVLCVPLKIDGRVIGVIQALNKKGPGGFTDRDLTLLTAFAASATIAIENARLFAEASQAQTLRILNEQLALLNQIGSEMTSSLNLEQVLATIMEGINTLIGVERASIFLIDDETGSLDLKYSLGRKENISLPPPWGGIVGWVATCGEPTIVNDVRADRRFLADIDAATQFDTRSILSVPLKLDDRIIGAIEMLNKLNGPFTDADRDLLIDIGKWAAIALHNARLYHELAETRSRLASAETVAAMSDIALDLTHRLNNRIAAARSLAMRIQTRFPTEMQNAVLAELVERIRQAAVDSLDIIRRIRKPYDLADMQAVEVTACLERALSNFRLEANIQVVRQYTAALPPVLATAEKLVEAFSHIIGNALDAMPHGGQLRLETRLAAGRRIEAVIADTGQGISPEVLAHIFEPFYTTKAREGRGLGLGLWLTRMYIGRLGGEVKLDSQLGHGTTVRMVLPAMREAQ